VDRRKSAYGAERGRPVTLRALATVVTDMLGGCNGLCILIVASVYHHRSIAVMMYTK
jgi:hypothetical protein